MSNFHRDIQFRRFCAYGFLKNLRFFDIFFLLFLYENDQSYMAIGSLYAIREGIIYIMEVPSGLLADNFGRKNALLAGLIAYIASFLVFYFSREFWGYAIGMTLYGLGDAFRSGTNKGMIMDYLRRNGWIQYKVAYYGLTRSWSQRGSALSALIAGILVYFQGSYNFVFLIALLPYSINLINIYSYPNYLNFSPKKNTQSQVTTSSIFTVFINSLKQPNTLKIINSAAMHTSFMKSLKDYIQPIMLQVAFLLPLMGQPNIQNKNALVIGILYTILFLLTSQASKYAHFLLTLKHGNLSLITLCLGLSCGVVAGVFHQFQLPIASLVFFISIYLIENLRKPILTGELADAVPGDVLTSILSVQSLYQSVLAIGIALFMGFLADRYDIGSAFATSSATLLLITITLNSLSSKGLSKNSKVN